MIVKVKGGRWLVIKGGQTYDDSKRPGVDQKKRVLQGRKVCRLYSGEGGGTRPGPTKRGKRGQIVEGSERGASNLE